MTNNRWLFFRKFLHQPKDVGSVTPSSRWLAKRMLNAVRWDDAEAVAELGSGTGAITRHLAWRVYDQTKVLLFEQDYAMRSRLEREYPQYACYPDAAELTSAARGEGIAQLDCVISGLPFFNFPQAIRDRLLEQIVTALKPGGQFVAFQYSLQMRPQLARLFEIEQIEFVPFNLPPAFVYVCRKRSG